MIVEKHPPLVMKFVTDPEELEKAKIQDGQYEKNRAWLQPRVPEIYAANRGKCICVAGQELYVADTAQEVIDVARRAHPEDEGLLLRYIPKHKRERIYADLRILACE